MLPPDPLHCNLLGPCNDVLELLEKMYPVEMTEEFYKNLGLKKSGEGPGGKFAGPSIREILKEHRLQQLESILPTNSIAVEFTDYMRSIRSVHQMCVAKNLDPNYSEIIHDFSQKFYSMFMEYGLSMTLKIHVIIHHYKYYFDKTGKIFKYTSAPSPRTPFSKKFLAKYPHLAEI